MHNKHIERYIRIHNASPSNKKDTEQGEHLHSGGDLLVAVQNHIVHLTGGGDAQRHHLLNQVNFLGEFLRWPAARDTQFQRSSQQKKKK